MLPDPGHGFGDVLGRADSDRAGEPTGRGIADLDRVDGAADALGAVDSLGCLLGDAALHW
jgi:hypothetical protein